MKSDGEKILMGCSVRLNRLWEGLLVFFLILGPAHLLAQGEGVRMYGKDEVPSAQELTDILFPDMAAGGGMKTRGLVIHGEQPPDPSQAVGFNISFKFDSIEMIGNYREVLDQVAAMMKSEAISGQVLVVEGHTDLVGNPAYNRKLSERRAGAVKDYLVARGVDVRRLQVEGKGMSDPLPGYAGDDGIQRRVQFRRLQ